MFSDLVQAIDSGCLVPDIAFLAGHVGDKDNQGCRVLHQLLVLLQPYPELLGRKELSEAGGLTELQPVVGKSRFFGIGIDPNDEIGLDFWEFLGRLYFSQRVDVEIPAFFMNSAHFLNPKLGEWLQENLILIWELRILFDRVSLKDVQLQEIIYLVGLEDVLRFGE